MSSEKKQMIGKWTEEEDTMLARAVAEHGSNWVAIAALMPGRTNTKCGRTNAKCRQHWTRGMSTVSRRSWTLEEDDKLIEEINKHGKV
jgi:3-keto-L-gulonate-6-phosphate decarboxylase